MKEVTMKRPEPKPCIFIGSSRKDLKRFPAKVQNRMGHALHQVQEGEEPIAAKALKGFGGRAILELIDDFDSDTYRAVYTVRFAGVVYVLHAFQKKAKKGIATPQQDIELIKSRLRDAEEHYRARADKGGRKP
jgi:phage-related protein